MSLCTQALKELLTVMGIHEFDGATGIIATCSWGLLCITGPICLHDLRWLPEPAAGGKMTIELTASSRARGALA